MARRKKAHQFGPFTRSQLAEKWNRGQVPWPGQLQCTVQPVDVWAIMIKGPADLEIRLRVIVHVYT